jgi:Ca2+:H+ antiporter
MSATTSPQSSKAALMARWSLLAFAPVTIALAHVAPHQSAAIFVCGCLAVIPLAGLMGEATEVLAARAGSGLGGLMNATFGNAAELILGFSALRAGHPEVVKASITGSILGNILLILGLAMLLGGLRFKEQHFSRRAAESGGAMMLLAVVGLIVPAILHVTRPDLADKTMFTMSIAISAVLLLLYALSLFFQLRTHTDLYEIEGAAGGAGVPDAEEPHLTTRQALVRLVLATAGVAVLSEYLVHALEGATASFGFTATFVGVIVLAVVGNAAEHASAVHMAMQGRMDLALSVALESSKQIALFAAPVLVLASGFLGVPMSLEFTPLETVGMGVSVLAVTLIALDGRSNWLEGAMLLGLYAILGVAFYFTP